MTHTTAILILLLAAVLEAAGDALMRAGLHRSSLMHRAVLFTLSGIALFAYGWTVNAPSWDLGKLIGIYVVFFFVISWLIFKQPPSPAILIGGVVIVAGGFVISVVGP